MKNPVFIIHLGTSQNFIIGVDKRIFIMYIESVRWSVKQTLNKNSREEKMKMITINPVKFNSTKKYVSFGDGSNMNNTTQSMAILALQNPTARREFEGNLNNALPSNPFVSTIKKIARTYKYVVSSGSNPNKEPDQHISFLG